MSHDISRRITEIGEHNVLSDAPAHHILNNNSTSNNLFAPRAPTNEQVIRNEVIPTDNMTFTKSILLSRNAGASSGTPGGIIAANNGNATPGLGGLSGSKKLSSNNLLNLTAPSPPGGPSTANGLLGLTPISPNESLTTTLGAPPTTGSISPLPELLITNPQETPAAILEDSELDALAGDVYGNEEEYLHVGYGGRTDLQQSNIRAILTSSYNKQKEIVDLYPEDPQAPRMTAIELAIQELKDGVRAMDRGEKKPIPTFTRCHLNTNWITDIYSSSHNNLNNSDNDNSLLDSSLYENHSTSLSIENGTGSCAAGGARPSSALSGNNNQHQQQDNNNDDQLDSIDTSSNQNLNELMAREEGAGDNRDRVTFNLASPTNTAHTASNNNNGGGYHRKKLSSHNFSNAMNNMAQRNDPLLSTLTNQNQKRVRTYDDAADPEKKSLALSFLNCLRLRKEFLFVPSVVDRRSYDIMAQPPAYTPCMGERIARPLFESLATTTETITTIQQTTTNSLIQQQQQGDDIMVTLHRDMTPPHHLITAGSSNNGNNAIVTRNNNNQVSPIATTTTTITSTAIKEHGARVSAPRNLDNNLFENGQSATSKAVAAEKASKANNFIHHQHNRSDVHSLLTTPTAAALGYTTQTSPDNHTLTRQMSSCSRQEYKFDNNNNKGSYTNNSNNAHARNFNQTQHQSNILTTTTSTTTTTKMSSLVGLLDTNLSRDLINNPNDFVFGFCNGVVHLYHRDALNVMDEERSRKYGRTLDGSPNAKAFYKTDREIKREENYPGYISDIYHIALHQHRSYAQYKNNNDNNNNNNQRNTPKNNNNNNNKNNYNPNYNNIFPVPSFADFCDSMAYVVNLVNFGPAKTWSHSRLNMLETQKKLHCQLNDELEQAQCKVNRHRDFYNVRKVDNHIHHSACMNQKHFLRFIKKKLREPEANTTIVLQRNGQSLTLNQVFKSLNLTPYDLSIDMLDCHASSIFQRFDKFNAKYNPIGESRLREIFLKYNNHIKGKYLAEITREVFDDWEASKYGFAEPRVSIYGKDPNEWNALADWIIDNNLISPNVRWMIQIPRIFTAYRREGAIANLDDMLKNIFLPIFHATLYPESNPKLHALLNLIVGFDTVDDESKNNSTFYWHSTPPPHKIDSTEEDPHYCVFLYYLYANLRVLNELRQLTGQNTWALRPHSGEAGNSELNLASAFLLAKSINHGILLWNFPPLQYLYYLAQIPLSVSPLSNNMLFLEYQKNPFKRFFDRGLNVTLSTDDPLMLHMSKEAIIEEYSVAASVWKLNHLELCEIARNSVLHSGFEHVYKVHWLGNHYWMRNVDGSDIRCTNLSDIRVQFRWETLYQEHALLTHIDGQEDGVDATLLDPIY